MRAADADDVSAEVMADVLDVARHLLRVVDQRLVGIDFARWRAAQDVGKDVAFVATAIRVGARNGIVGDGVAAVVEENLAHLAAADLRMRRLVRVDVHHGAHHVDRGAEVRRREVGIDLRIVARSVGRLRKGHWLQPFG